MADIKFSCPHCHQHITCDELWGGHQLQCPSCQGTLTVPARPAPPTASAEPPPPPPPPARSHASVPAAGSGSSHVFKPPAATAPKLSIGQAHAPAQSAGPTPAKSIPIRNLAPPPPKKANPIFTILKVTAVVAVLGVAGYFGFTWLRNYQDKSNAKARSEEARSGGESQVGHIANLNRVLDATEPGHLGEEPGVHMAGATAHPTGVGSEIAMGNEAAAAARSAAGAPGGMTPPAYTLDVNQATIPGGRVNGTLSGTNFVADTARFDRIGTAEVLRLIEGSTLSPDRQVLIYLHLKAGEKLGGQTLTIASDARGPQVTKMWKATPRSAPSFKPYNSGYAMKLELGALTNDAVAGKIYLALPDPEQSVLAGEFNATVAPIEPTQPGAPVATPVARPSTPADKAMMDRYGIRR